LDTMVANIDFLKGLLVYLTRDIFNPALVQRFEMFLDNSPSYDTVVEQDPHLPAIRALISEMSLTVQMPDKLVELYKKQPFKMQLFLYDRYQLALEDLDSKHSDKETYTVPIRLDELFKWFFITLWGY